MAIVEAFASGVLTSALNGATDTELDAIIAVAADEPDPLRCCTLLNNAAFQWLETARASGRVGYTDALLRSYGLNAFFLVNFET
jgi:hypothetical protein